MKIKKKPINTTFLRIFVKHSIPILRTPIIDTENLRISLIYLQLARLSLPRIYPEIKAISVTVNIQSSKDVTEMSISRHRPSVACSYYSPCLVP